MRDVQSHWRLLSPKDGAEVDRAVRSALAQSLRIIYGQGQNGFSYDEGRLDRLLSDIAQGPVRPAVFGIYTDLVESRHAGDAGTLKALSDLLLDLEAPADTLRIANLIDEDLGAQQAQRYARLVDDDAEQRYRLAPATAQFAEASRRVADVLSLLDQGVPELAQELRGLVREIVLVSEADAPADAQAMGFEGASTFYLWGALFLNIGNATRLDLAQSLAHESGHLLLFGLMMGRPLVENDPEERYASPLRQDPRPMEGLVHAAYVLARMSYALERLLESSLLTPEEQHKARAELANHHRRFSDSLPVIEEHARLTPQGAAIWRGAVEYMAATAA